MTEKQKAPAVSKEQHVANIAARAANLSRCGLCENDRRLILSMTLSDIAEEFRLPEWLLVRVVETLTMASNVGRRKELEDIMRKEGIE